jgi:hypothetical protein
VLVSEAGQEGHLRQETALLEPSVARSRR